MDKNPEIRERETIIAYLKQEYTQLQKGEMYYLLEGINWVIDRLEGRPTDDSYEPIPLMTFGEFKASIKERGKD